MKQQKWSEISAPWIEIDEFADTVIDNVRILDILDHWKLTYTQCASGNFTHKMICPLPSHADGNERTASCYVSETTNSFFCYGCNSGSSIIDLVMLYSGKPYYEAVRWLGAFGNISIESLSDLPKEPKKKRDPEHTINKQVFYAGIIIREFLAKFKGKVGYKKWCAWSDKQFTKLDEFMNNLTDSDWEKVKLYREKLIKYLKDKI